MRERMGLDPPVPVQVRHFVASAATGDLGYDVWSRRPVPDRILEVFPATLVLGIAALGRALGLGVALGCDAVLWRGTLADRLPGVLSVGLISVPASVVAVYAILIFAVWPRWLPAIA